MPETITISLEDFNHYAQCERKLDALEAAGVDNWEGYEHAMDILAEWDLDDGYETAMDADLDDDDTELEDGEG